MAEEGKLMRIRDLARAAGVSMQTIHYYLRERLLPPPLKTAPNMAYYGPEYVEEIRLIKELQERRYLPLSVIKLVLEARRAGKDVSQLQDMRLSLEEIFRPLGPEDELEPAGLVELVAMTGLAAETLEKLEEVGLLVPVLTPAGKRYDDLDVRVARTARELLNLGLTPSVLGFYTQYIEALRTEARVIHEKLFHSSGIPTRVSGKRVKELLDDLKAALATRVYRQVAVLSHRHQCGDEG